MKNNIKPKGEKMKNNIYDIFNNEKKQEKKQEKLKEIKDNKSYFVILFYVIILLIFIMCVSVYGFFSGYNQLDLAQNMKYLESDLNINLLDYQSDGEYRTFEEMYIIGFNQMETYFFMFGFSALILGYLLAEILINLLFQIDNKK